MCVSYTAWRHQERQALNRLTTEMNTTFMRLFNPHESPQVTLSTKSNENLKNFPTKEQYDVDMKLVQESLTDHKNYAKMLKGKIAENIIRINFMRQRLNDNERRIIKLESASPDPFLDLTTNRGNKPTENVIYPTDETS